MTSAFAPTPPVNTSRRNVLIASGVVLFHLAALWALQSGLVRRTVELVVPAVLLTEIITPPAPKVEVPAPAPAPEPPRPKQPELKKPAPQPAPKPEAKLEPLPAPPAPTAQAEPATATPAPPAPAAAAAPSPAPAPVSTKVELPSSDAEYLRNPKPPYPFQSRRLGEQGKVVLLVLVGVDGTAKEVKIKQSSGYDRLDESARQTVLSKYRFVPGKRGGAPEAMWFDLPVIFSLEQ
jgi:protein TonB